MPEKRILNKFDQSDITQLLAILDECAEFQKDKPNPLYFYEDMCEFTEWLKKQFIHRNQDDFVVSGLFENNILIQIIVGYKIEIAWHKTKIENDLPFYVVGLVYFKNGDWKVPREDISNLDELVTDHFEKQGYTEGYMTIKAPNFVVRNNDGAKINKFMNEVFIKTFKESKHNFFIEKIFRTNEDLMAYDFRGMKALLPKRIKRPLFLLSFKLKPEYRTV